MEKQYGSPLFKISLSDFTLFVEIYYLRRKIENASSREI